MKFSLTLRQLQRIVKEADSDEWEDIITFEVSNDRLIIDQLDWSHQERKSLMNKPV